MAVDRTIATSRGAAPDRIGLARLYEVLAAVECSFGREVPLRFVHTLLTVALNEDATGIDIARLVRSRPATTHNDLKALGDETRHGDPGMGLVEHRTDPLHRTQHLHSVTARGREVLKGLAAPLG